MGTYTRCGIVFSVGTTDWAQVLGHDACVDPITRNVIANLVHA